MMKKLFSLILALTLVISMGVTAFAAEGEDEKESVTTGSYDADVYGTYVAGSTGETIYSVDIEWSNLSFTYDAGSKTWNPSKHDYDIVDATGWKDESGSITVTNHSNASIVARPTWKAADGCEDAVMNFYDGEETVSRLTIASAEPTEGQDSGTAQKGTFTVKPSGRLPGNLGENKTIGQITVSIEPVSSYDESTNTTTVYNGGDLAAALNSGKNVVLGCDMTCDTQLRLASGTNVTLDLNRHTLTMTYNAYPLWIDSGASVTIKSTTGGEISTPNSVYSINIDGSLNIVSGVISTRMLLDQGSLNVSGGYVKEVTASGGTCTITGGTFGFDPTQYVDTNNYSVTKDEATNAWTVTAKAG